MILHKKPLESTIIKNDICIHDTCMHARYLCSCAHSALRLNKAMPTVRATLGYIVYKEVP